MSGRLIGVVGPSGAGKDTVMRAMIDARPSLAVVRRVITRPADPGGEDYDTVSKDVFDRMCQDGAFCLQWRAHGLSYGIPSETQTRLADGQTLLVNLSRSVLAQASGLFDRFSVLSVTAQPATLARRLALRGRESAADIKLRLSRQVSPLPADLRIMTVANDGSLDDAVRCALALLDREDAP